MTLAKQDKPVSLRKRTQFLTTKASGQRWVTPAFIFQTGPRSEKESAEGLCGFGLTASKKMIGIAVVRNRARRRLRALVNEVFPLYAMDGKNVVLIAREPVLTRPYADLRKDLEWALRRLGFAKRSAA